MSSLTQSCEASATYWEWATKAIHQVPRSKTPRRRSSEPIAASAAAPAAMPAVVSAAAPAAVAVLVAALLQRPLLRVLVRRLLLLQLSQVLLLRLLF